MANRLLRSDLGSEPGTCSSEAIQLSCAPRVTPLSRLLSKPWLSALLCRPPASDALLRCFEGCGEGRAANDDLSGGLAAPFCVEASLREGLESPRLELTSRDVRSEAEVRSYVLNTPASGRELRSCAESSEHRVSTRGYEYS